MYCMVFSNNSPPFTSLVFTLKNAFEKKSYLGEMLIEQVIEFKLRSLGPLNRTCTPTTGYFHLKTKISKENL